MTAGAILSEPRKRSDVVSGLCISSHIVLVLLPVYIAACLPPGPSAILLWLLFGAGANGLLNLMHECAHLHVFRRRSLAVFLGRWILGPLALTDFDGYQKRHWEHHRKLGEPEDPKYIYHRSIRGWKLISLAFNCLLLIEAFNKFFFQASSREAGMPPSRMWIARALLFQAIFAGSLFFAASLAFPDNRAQAMLSALMAYCGVYVYALGSLTVFAASLRAIAEHQIGNDQGEIVNGAALRNFSCGPLATVFMGAYGFAHHATHHEEPALPYYLLKDRTAELASSDKAFVPRFTYGSTLYSLFQRA